MAYALDQDQLSSIEEILQKNLIELGARCVILVDMAGQIMADVELEPLEPEVTEARRARNVPPEAVTLFARAQVFQDDGNTDRAIELYRRITERFPDYTEAQEALDGISGDFQDAGSG